MSGSRRSPRKGSPFGLAKRHDEMGDGLVELTPAQIEAVELTAAELANRLATNTTISGYQPNLSQIDLQLCLSMLLVSILQRPLSPFTALLGQYNIDRENVKLLFKALKHEIENNKEFVSEMKRFFEKNMKQRRELSEVWFELMCRELDQVLADLNRPVEKGAEKWANLNALETVQMLNQIFANRVFTRRSAVLSNGISAINRTGLEFAVSENDPKVIIATATTVTNMQCVLDADKNRMVMIAAGAHQTQELIHEFNVKKEKDSNVFVYSAPALAEEDIDFLREYFVKLDPSDESYRENGIAQREGKDSAQNESMQLREDSAVSEHVQETEAPSEDTSDRHARAARIMTTVFAAQAAVDAHQEGVGDTAEVQLDDTLSALMNLWSGRHIDLTHSQQVVVSTMPFTSHLIGQAAQQHSERDIKKDHSEDPGLA